MSDALVAVPASNEEHSRTVGDGSYDSSGRNTCAGRVDLATGTSIATNRTAIAGTAGRGSSWVTSGNI